MEEMTPKPAKGAKSKVLGCLVPLVLIGVGAWVFYETQLRVKLVSLDRTPIELEKDVQAMLKQLAPEATVIPGSAKGSMLRVLLEPPRYYVARIPPDSLLALVSAAKQVASMPTANSRRVGLKEWPYFKGTSNQPEWWRSDVPVIILETSIGRAGKTYIIGEDGRVMIMR